MGMERSADAPAENITDPAMGAKAIGPPEKEPRISQLSRINKN
jgi:hypothetical protein